MNGAFSSRPARVLAEHLASDARLYRNGAAAVEEGELEYYIRSLLGLVQEAALRAGVDEAVVSLTMDLAASALEEVDWDEVVDAVYRVRV